jgi:hypothetical protein
MAAIDDDKNLSAAGKESKKKGIAEAAISDFEKSKTLSAARDSVAHQITKWDEEIGLTSKTPPTIGESVQLTEIRSYISAMKGNRVDFLAKHAGDPRVVAAVLGAPAFLSGLTDADINIVKSQVTNRLAPEIAEARAERQRRCKRPKPVGARRSGRSAIAVVWGDPTMEWCESPQRPMWLRRAPPCILRAGPGRPRPMASVAPPIHSRTPDPCTCQATQQRGQRRSSVSCSSVCVKGST